MAEQINLSSRSSSDENDETNCSAMLLDLEALNCPICFDALTSSIFQCDNGHIACSTCCDKLMNKCPSCDSPVGQIRCRAMERVISAIIVPCPNAKLGCTKSFSYGTELTHEKECAFSRCYCPAENCDYTGSYKDIYSHFDVHKGEARYNYQFLFDEYSIINFELTEFTSVVLKGHEAGILFVVQCFSEPHGVCVTVSCIAPSVLEVGHESSETEVGKP
ncbi:E3 ubiquitin-protein ligase SINA-like 7 [Eutrema salsugineum]|uniref:E3 ubiquitin-protein ligase SINA-like 7 n=1 Tax=Eutrema salsugineum TaxID=72664 RepID=UPI000CECE3E2|nr:E3 ubiquitin-protein ligase SINA-like 7 [Eutrema salsugineum]